MHVSDENLKCLEWEKKRSEKWFLPLQVDSYKTFLCTLARRKKQHFRTAQTSFRVIRLMAIKRIHRSEIHSTCDCTMWELLSFASTFFPSKKTWTRQLQPRGHLNSTIAFAEAPRQHLTQIPVTHRSCFRYNFSFPLFSSSFAVLAHSGEEFFPKPRSARKKDLLAINQMKLSVWTLDMVGEG